MKIRTETAIWSILSRTDVHAFHPSIKALLCRYTYTVNNTILFWRQGGHKALKEAVISLVCKQVSGMASTSQLDLEAMHKNKVTTMGLMNVELKTLCENNFKGIKSVGITAIEYLDKMPRKEEKRNLYALIPLLGLLILLGVGLYYSGDRVVKFAEEKIEIPSIIPEVHADEPTIVHHQNPAPTPAVTPNPVVINEGPFAMAPPRVVAGGQRLHLNVFIPRSGRSAGNLVTFTFNRPTHFEWHARGNLMVGDCLADGTIVFDATTQTALGDELSGGLDNGLLWKLQLSADFNDMHVEFNSTDPEAIQCARVDWDNDVVKIVNDPIRQRLYDCSDPI